MLRLKCNPVYCCSAIAIWTIIQTGLHLYAIVYVMWWRDCNSDSTTENMLYLVYFFTRRCENETRHSLQMNRNLVISIINTDVIDNTNLNNTLDSMILTYVILDALWIVAAVALLTAAVLDIREFWALLFYLPWITIATIILFFDVFCSIFFGLQIPSEGTIFDWLNFIGINIKINDIQKLEGDMPSLVTGAASIIMTFVSARGVVIWVINLVAIIYVIKVTIRVAKKKSPTPNQNSERYPTFNAEERIRKWHQFYSAEAGATRTQGSLRENSFDIEDDVGSFSEITSTSGNVPSEGSQISNKSSVRRGVISPECRRKIDQLQLSELRGQLPWSYVDGGRTPDPVRPDVVPERNYVKHIDEGASRF